MAARTSAILRADVGGATAAARTRIAAIAPRWPRDPGCSDACACEKGLDEDGDGSMGYRTDGTGEPRCAAPHGRSGTPRGTSSGLLGLEGLALVGLAAAVGAGCNRRRRRVSAE